VAQAATRHVWEEVMALTPEGRIKAQIKPILKARNIWYFMPQNVGMGVSGVPDFICCVPLTADGTSGRLLGIECKAPGKRRNTTALQDIQIAAIRQARGWALIVDDPAQLEEFLDHVGCPTAPSNSTQGEQP
jgi:hypothetical protein